MIINKDCMTDTINFIIENSKFPDTVINPSNQSLSVDDLKPSVVKINELFETLSNNYNTEEIKTVLYFLEKNKFIILPTHGSGYCSRVEITERGCAMLFDKLF